MYDVREIFLNRMNCVDKYDRSRIPWYIMVPKIEIIGVSLTPPLIRTTGLSESTSRVKPPDGILTSIIDHSKIWSCSTLEMRPASLPSLADSFTEMRKCLSFGTSDSKNCGGWCTLNSGTNWPDLKPGSGFPSSRSRENETISLTS